jgi:hypothetical protein
MQMLALPRVVQQAMPVTEVDFLRHPKHRLPHPHRPRSVHPSTRSFRNSNGSKLDTQRFASLGDDVRDRFVETD